MNLGKKLRIIRKQKGLTQKQVSDFLNISSMSYSRYEQNIRKPDLETLSKLAELFDVGAEYILDDYNEYFDEFYNYEEMLSEDDYLLLSLLSKRLQIEKKATVLINRVNSIVEDSVPAKKYELTNIRREMGNLFIENKNIEDLIVDFGGYLDIEDALIETMHKISIKK